jgi:choline dehydrogenase-like flavoprotein
VSDDLTTTDWDVIVIGTGIGGGVIGRRLAEGGAKVLFLEKGPRGKRVEQTPLNPEIWDEVARLARGYWPKPMQVTLNGRESTFHGPVGAGVGGASAFYAATLERPEPHDLDETDGMAHPTGGWPVGYLQFQPYFEAAEQLFFVNGTNDPLSTTPSESLLPAPPLGAAEQSIFNQLEGNGLHPYQAHSAVRNVEGCLSCLGFKCPKSCKMDGRSAGVEPALATGNAALLDLCDVTRIHQGGDGVTKISARHDGRDIEFSARAYVLAGGALASPRLLLQSASEAAPAGVGNAHDQVGRNLMFHLNEMFAVWPSQKTDGPSKGIGLRDLYTADGQRQGMVQAMGIEARYGEIVHYLNMAFDRSRLARFKQLRGLTRIPAAIAVRLFGNAAIFAGILEDLPYAENRVLLHEADPDVMRFTYQFAPELLARRALFRKNIKRAFRGMRPVFLGYQPEVNYGHPCGTLRFGDDPKTSVLNTDCRVHGMRNLFVADASFMPTSFGANPSLTIAANALRVGDHILATLKSGEMS